jgi:hypothetical protein
MLSFIEFLEKEEKKYIKKIDKNISAEVLNLDNTIGSNKLSSVSFPNQNSSQTSENIEQNVSTTPSTRRNSFSSLSEINGCGGETISLIKRRWKHLLSSFYNPESKVFFSLFYYVKKKFNTSVIIPIFQNMKFDIAHNHQYLSDPLRNLHLILTPLAHFLMPLTYGILRKHRILFTIIIITIITMYFKFRISQDSGGSLLKHVLESFLRMDNQSEPSADFIFTDESVLAGL